MITVYDMTSGNLRKEFEEGRQTQSIQQVESHETVYAPELQLQEIAMEAPDSSDTLPQHLLGINAGDFIKNMK